MENERYRVIYSGQVLPDFTPEVVKQNIQQLFKLDDILLEKLFSGKPIVLKKNIDSTTANRYREVLANSGAEVHIDPPIESLPANDLINFDKSVQLESDAVDDMDQLGSEASQLKTLDSTLLEPSIPTKQANPDSKKSTSAEPTEMDWVYCRECGERIGSKDKKCVGCGASQHVGTPRSKNKAGLLAVFLGFTGAHRFYLGQWWGIFYFLLSFLAWPVAIVEGIVFFLTKEKNWRKKYDDVVGFSGPAAIIIAIIGSVFVIGILASIAVPAYQDYVSRSRVATAMKTFIETRTIVEETIEQERVLPNNNKEAGLEQSISGQFVKSIQVQQNGVMTLVLEDEHNRSIHAKTIVSAPSVLGGKLQWDCSGGTLARRFRPPECRQGQLQQQQPKSGKKWVNAADGASRIQVPETWRERSDLSEDSSLTQANTRNEQYLVVITEPKLDFNENFKIQDYQSLLVENNFAEFTVQPDKPITVDGMQGIQNVITGEIDNIKISYLLNCFEGEDNFYQVLFWTLSSKWEKNREVFERSLASFEQN